MAETLYTATVTSTGGGRDGRVESACGDLALDVRPPKELGGAGGAANPELLFAAAWAACFNGALQLIMKNAGVDVAKHQPTVTADASLNRDPSGVGFRISGKVTVVFENQDQLADAADLVAKAHAFCPYSKAVRGEFDGEAVLG
ncbi:Ohr family peroxiredoxin [Corynebacterium canis]|uniref:Ohr family peroxiredoxin n=1 Tax=Corynebacterium canis TaxID=679663 RepID=A0A5C5UG92_9CORY|nr:Ohr family peroxiredoxin [Corynebacterium canis]TWT25691.1 Ohr family peroxiredoxin [Corynebacterium canis]WJY73999.1 Organic hydroperoxide resistance protein OhrB [Corynebacterium canis]